MIYKLIGKILFVLGFKPCIAVFTTNSAPEIFAAGYFEIPCDWDYIAFRFPIPLDWAQKYYDKKHGNI